MSKRRLTRRGERVLMGALGLNIAFGMLFLFSYAGGIEYADLTHTEFPLSNIFWGIIPLSIHLGLVKIAKHYE